MDKNLQQNVLDVEADTVEVRVTAHSDVAEVKSQESYAHHAYYGEGYTSPEIHMHSFKPYQSTRAKLWLVVISVSLLAVTVGLNQKLKQSTVQGALHHNQSLSYGQQKLAKTMDMMAMNTLAFEQSLTQFGKVVENKQALGEVETTLYKQHGSQKVMSDQEARDLLIRAGYSPTQITDQQMASFKQRYQGVDGDVNFARDVAGDLVKEEVESFVHKAKLVSHVGEYIYQRITQD